MLTSTISNLQSTASVDDLENYLRQVNYTLSHFNRDLYTHHSSSLTRLKQTLVDLEVAQIRHTAISQGFWDFYPTSDRVILKMLLVADIHPYHHILEPSAGTGDLIQAIARLGVNKIDCFELHPLLKQAIALQGFTLIGSRL